MATTLTPAYGRDYKSKNEVLSDFISGKDFIYNSFGSPHDGRVCNKADLEAAGEKIVMFRYKRNMNVFSQDITNIKLPKLPTSKADNTGKTFKVTQTIKQAEKAMFDGFWKPRCPGCGTARTMEPDANGFQCERCNATIKLFPLF